MTFIDYASFATGGHPSWLGYLNQPLSGRGLTSYSSLTNGIADIAVTTGNAHAAAYIGIARVALAISRSAYNIFYEDELAPHDLPHGLNFDSMLLTQTIRGVSETCGYGPLFLIPDIIATVFRFATYRQQA